MYVKTLSFFETQLDYIYFIQGLAFILLAIAAIIMHLRKTQPLSWGWLSAFAFLQGINAWIGITALFSIQNTVILTLETALTWTSYIALLMFGSYILPPPIRLLTVAAAIIASIAAALIFPESTDIMIILSIAFPASVLSVVSFLNYVKNSENNILKLVSFALFLYVTVIGTDLADQNLLSSWTGFPAEMLQMALSLCIAMCIWLYYLQEQDYQAESRYPIYPPLAKKLILLLTVITVAGFIFTNTMGERKESLMLKEFLTRVTLASKIIDLHQIAQLRGDMDDIGTPAYEGLKHWLSDINIASRFTYLMTLRNGQVYFLVDSEDSKSEDCSPPGQLYEETTPEFFHALIAQQPFIIGPESDHWGTYITAVVPLGQLLAHKEPVYLLFDIDYEEWKNDIALSRQIGIFITLLSIILVLYFFLASNRIFQINSRLKAERNLFIGGPAVIIKWKVTEEKWWVTYASANIQSHLQIASETVVMDEHSLMDYVHPDDRAIMLDGIHKLRSDQDEFEHEVRLLHADGSYRWFHLFMIRQIDRYAEWFQGYFTEISIQKEAEENAAYLATHDILTGLPKMAILEEFFNKAKRFAKRTETKAALLYLDIDRFNRINEGYGHAFGNELILLASKRLREVLPENITISREGGDEFTILVTNAQDNDEIALIAQKIIWEFSKPFIIENEPIVVSCSIGIAVFPDDGRFMGVLLQQADVALAYAKENGKNTYAFTSKYANDEITRRLTIESQLHTALEKEEFSIHYQPKINRITGKAAGAEALIRWENPVLGKVSPSDFIPIAEENGLIVPIGKWILEEVCRQSLKWQKKGLEPINIAVNVSVIQLKRTDFITGIKILLQETTLQPSYLELELTESILANEDETIIETLRDLREMGMGISIDDFGTGYSNFLYLKRFNVTKLKIDLSFVSGIESDNESKTIVETMIKFGKSLGLSTIAEGVETQSQLDILSRMQCDEFQGYYFSKPLPAEEFERFLESFNRSAGHQ